jgi:hypothetical protein
MLCPPAKISRCYLCWQAHFDLFSVHGVPSSFHCFAEIATLPLNTVRLITV